MTTETRSPRQEARPYGVAALGVAVLAGCFAAVVVAVLAVVLDGSAGLVGALAGAGVTVLVLATGFAVVDMVSTAMPRFSLVFAMLTYTSQILLLAVLLAALRSADDIGQTLTPGWFAGGVIAVALAWTVCLVVHAMSARVPLYDLPDHAPAVPSSVTSEGSER